MSIKLPVDKAEAKLLLSKMSWRERLAAPAVVLILWFSTF